MKYSLIALSLLCLTACKADVQTEPPKTTKPPKTDGFKFEFPLDCTLGETCWLMNYVDHDTRDGSVRDAKCEARSYDGHKGTDVAIRDWSSTAQGVAIIAPAAGVVLGVRDGESDQFPTEAQKALIKKRGRECGNGVRIDHGQGWVTQFCHMKKGSVSVAYGAEIAVGTKLGEVGMSGITDHPHVHMTLRKDEAVVDPYTGRQASQSCGLEAAAPLWKDKTPYNGFGVFDAGFSDSAPDFKAIARGQRATQPQDTSPAFIFYVNYFGARAGDRVELIIRQPDGQVFRENTILQDRTKARQAYFIGRKNSKGRFMSGQWSAEATVYRKDTGERQRAERKITL